MFGKYRGDFEKNPGVLFIFTEKKDYAGKPKGAFRNCAGNDTVYANAAAPAVVDQQQAGICRRYPAVVCIHF